MNGRRPLRWMTNLLDRLVSGPHGDALAGDLIEQYREGRSAAWFWRQSLFAIIVSGAKDRTFGGPAILAWLSVILLISIGAVRHPSGVYGEGKPLLIEDFALLVVYGAFAVRVWRQRGAAVRDALWAAGRTGVLMGAISIPLHAIDYFAPARNHSIDLALGAGSRLLILALFGAVGSAAWSRTRSRLWPVIAGLWCAPSRCCLRSAADSRRTSFWKRTPHRA